MINLKIRTEYSFRFAYGKTKDIISSQEKALAITDRGNTFGHVPFWKECRKQVKKPILGVELLFVEDCSLKVKQTTYPITFLAKNLEGLKELYNLVYKSSKTQYRGVSRLEFKDLSNISENIVIIYENYILEEYINSKSCYYGFHPRSSFYDFSKQSKPIVSVSDNLFDEATSKKLYETILFDPVKLGMKFGSSKHNEMTHILDEFEWKSATKDELSEEQQTEALKNCLDIADSIEEFDLNKAELPIHTEERSLMDLCIEGAEIRGIDLADEKYKERLELELSVIKEKNFEDYFYLVYDLVKFAKKHMLVGPGRGSGAGSLLCYLLEITDVDPIPYDLLFYRFLSPHRSDPPDLDIDFQDTKRTILLDYLKNKYGEDCVAKLGTISRYKPDSVLLEVGKVLSIPPWEMKDLKKSVIKRPDGDERSDKCLNDTFETLKVGKNYLSLNPNLEYSKFIEGHTRHSGQHAGAIIVSDKPLTNYCSVDDSIEGCQIDKKGTEDLNLLKMDCLGLSVLSQIQTCLDMVGKDRDYLLNYPTDDKKVFDVINNGLFSGIFQFSGKALKDICKNIEVRSFDDMVAVTSLARPGADSGSYIKLHNEGIKKYKHPLLEPILSDTYGVIVYQEQVMRIVRELGNFSWEATSEIRKAIGGSKGTEYMNKLKEEFIKGCLENRIESDISAYIWTDITNMGSYAFNKSHAVAYSYLSYWCMVLKANFPLQFAVSNLRNAHGTDDESVDKVRTILRELVHEGFEYIPFDKHLSEIEWSISDNKLVGGYTNIKGVGKTKAKQIISKIKKGENLTPAQNKLVEYAKTPFDNIYEIRDDLKLIYDNWPLFFGQKPYEISDIDETNDLIRLAGKIKKIMLKDMNDPQQLEKRKTGLIEGQTTFLDFYLEGSDEDLIFCRIDHNNYEKHGKPIEEDKEDGYHLILGSVWVSPDGFRFVKVQNIRKLTLDEIKEKINLDN